jgi:cell division protease FtsH
MIDEEVRKIVEQAHKEVVALLKENRGKLDSLAQALLEHETLDEDDAYRAAGVERSGDGAAEYAAAARTAST